MDSELESLHKIVENLLMEICEVLDNNILLLRELTKLTSGKSQWAVLLEKVNQQLNELTSVLNIPDDTVRTSSLAVVENTDVDTEE